MTFFVSLFLFFLVILSATGSYRACALSRGMMDIPNHRSAHIVPVPRGGGVVFVVGFLVFLSIAYYFSLMTWGEVFRFGCVGAGVAGIGFWDDRTSLSARIRLLGHAIAAGLVVYSLGGMPALTLFGWSLPVHAWWWNGFGILLIIWMTNLYNFMDGIDGIAALEAIFVCVAAGIFFEVQGHWELTLPLAFLAAGVLGFLCWNFPVARLFMGDVGSGFLGFFFGIFALYAAQINSDYFWVMLILLNVFIVDTTVTLIRRAWDGQRVFESHASHAYQYAKGFFQSHLFVTIGVLAINLIWLLPLALLVSFGLLNGFVGFLVSCLPLTFIAFQFKAGKVL
jgi:Fuc2NAc and GlcNAc transferase